mgnify:CR=1 FL=1
MYEVQSMDNVKKQKINTKSLEEKIDDNLLNGSIEITLLNRIYKNKLIDKKIYKQAKENIIKEYKLERCEIDFNF